MEKYYRPGDDMVEIRREDIDRKWIPWQYISKTELSKYLKLPNHVPLQKLLPYNEALGDRVFIPFPAPYRGYTYLPYSEYIAQQKFGEEFQDKWDHILLYGVPKKTEAEIRLQQQKHLSTPRKKILRDTYFGNGKTFPHT